MLSSGTDDLIHNKHWIVLLSGNRYGGRDNYRQDNRGYNRYDNRGESLRN